MMEMLMCHGRIFFKISRLGHDAKISGHLLNFKTMSLLEKFH